MTENERKKEHLERLIGGIWASPCERAMAKGYAEIIKKHSADLVECGVNLLINRYPEKRQGPQVLEACIKEILTEDSEREHQQQKAKTMSMADLTRSENTEVAAESIKVLYLALEHGKSHPLTIREVLGMDVKGVLHDWGVPGY